MRNFFKTIPPLTKDEAGKLKGGFRSIDTPNQGEDVDVTNYNCHGSRDFISERIDNMNCHRTCSCP